MRRAPSGRHLFVRFLALTSVNPRPAYLSALIAGLPPSRPRRPRQGRACSRWAPRRSAGSSSSAPPARRCTTSSPPPPVLDGRRRQHARPRPGRRDRAAAEDADRRRGCVGDAARPLPRALSPRLGEELEGAGAELGSGVRLHDREVAGLARPGWRRAAGAPRLAAGGVRPQRRPALVRDRAGCELVAHARRALCQDGGLRRVRFTDCRLTGIAWPECDLEDVAFWAAGSTSPACASRACSGSRSGLRPARGRLPGRRLGPSASRPATSGDRCSAAPAARRPSSTAASSTASTAWNGCAARAPSPTSSASRAPMAGALGSACWPTTSADAQPQRAAQEAIPATCAGCPPSTSRASPPLAEPDRRERRSPQREPGLHAAGAGDHLGEGNERDALVEGERGALVGGEQRERVVGRDAARRVAEIDVEEQVGGHRGHADPRDRRPAGEVVGVHHREGAVDPRERLQRRRGCDEQERDPPGRARLGQRRRLAERLGDRRGQAEGRGLPVELCHPDG